MRRLAQILLACTIAEALPSIRPGAEWTLYGNTYSGLTWLDKVQSKPTQAEVTAALSTCDAAKSARETAKFQAKLDAKNTNLGVNQRLNALLILLDLDR